MTGDPRPPARARFDPARVHARAPREGPRWLVAPGGLLRAPWRLLLFAASVVVAQLFATMLVAPLFAALSGAVGEPIAAYPWIMLAAVVAGSAVMLGAVDRRPWREVALGAEAWAPRRLAVGSALGVALIGGTALLLGAAGTLRFEAVPWPGDAAPHPVVAWSVNALRLLVFLAPAALWEELVFRGYLWHVAEAVGGRSVALWSTSVGFGVVHLMNPGAGVRTTLLVVLAGLCLGLVRDRLRSVPAAWQAHLAWNWVMAAVLHVPVSGVPLATPLYRGVVSGPDWLTGGAWGPEGGLAAALVMGGALAAAARRRAGPYVSG
jgi:membrane protease YdiL (CAAX protease family)